MESYKKDCEIGNNPMMFCVCRGKYAEGYDFKDSLCRKLYIIGVPNLYSKLPKYTKQFTINIYRLLVRKEYYKNLKGNQL